MRISPEVFSLVPDVATGDEAGIAQQTHGRLDQCGFAGAALAHDAEDFPLIHRKAHVLDDFDAVIGNINLFVFQYLSHRTYLPLLFGSA